MTVNEYQRSLIRRSYANDPVIQQLNAQHEHHAEEAERLLAKWEVLPTLALYIRVIGERNR